jgi:hypothetical protein
MDVFVAADQSIGFIDGIGWGPDGNLYITSTVSGGSGVTGILSFASDGTPLGVFGDTATSGLTSAAGLLFYDDGTPPPSPHGGGQHHAQLDALVLPASAPFGPSTVAVQDALPAASASTPFVSPLLQSVPARETSVLPQERSVQPEWATAAFAPEAILGGLTPLNIDPLFGKSWSHWGGTDL